MENLQHRSLSSLEARLISSLEFEQQMLVTLDDIERRTFYDALQQHVEPELTLQECASLIAKVLKGKPLPRLKDGRGCVRGRATAGTIILPRYARRDWYVLHEVAHVIMERRYDRMKYACHGPEFVRVYVDLIQRWTPKHRRVTASYIKGARVKCATAAWQEVSQ